MGHAGTIQIAGSRMGPIGFLVVGLIWSRVGFRRDGLTLLGHAYVGPGWGLEENT